jgi:DNA-directed RNA polymerase beta' subunit
MVKTGSNAVSGSWKIIETTVAAQVGQRPARSMPRTSSPSTLMLPDQRVRLLGMQSQDRAQGDALARARFAQHAEHSPRARSS